MFAFSEIHNWQGNPSVKQILVFPSELLKFEFEKTFAERVEKDGIKASDSNSGAVYKIRAVENLLSFWGGEIRCGSSGDLLLEQNAMADSYVECLNSMNNLLMGYIREAMYDNHKRLKLLLAQIQATGNHTVSS